MASHALRSSRIRLAEQVRPHLWYVTWYANVNTFPAPSSRHRHLHYAPLIVIAYHHDHDSIALYHPEDLGLSIQINGPEQQKLTIKLMSMMEFVNIYQI